MPGQGQLLGATQILTVVLVDLDPVLLLTLHRAVVKELAAGTPLDFRLIGSPPVVGDTVGTNFDHCVCSSILSERSYL